MARRKQHGDADDTFDEAFRELFVQAYRVARRILGDSSAAEDIAAEALSRAYAHWTRISALPYRDAWVLRVATNLALNATRRRTAVFDAPASGPTDDQTATRLALVAALRALPARQREVIVLRHLAGLSEPEVAERLGLSLGTVKTHLRRAKEKLRVELTPELLGGGS
ncbi:MAG TPA: sigma-70 family RNA polymerase sigma factor [Acidimicrobiia bacterium]|nr:sigma-70 family RNA polymerase sigma factor [Acidimicrobiia bacterium]